jgi:hypothetical protein
VAGTGREPGDRRQDPGDGGAGGRDDAVAERVVDEGPGLLGAQAFAGDDVLELGGAASGEERLPLVPGVAGDGDRLDEREDEVALVAQ